MPSPRTAPREHGEAEGAGRHREAEEEDGRLTPPWHQVGEEDRQRHRRRHQRGPSGPPQQARPSRRADPTGAKRHRAQQGEHERAAEGQRREQRRGPTSGLSGPVEILGGGGLGAECRGRGTWQPRCADQSGRRGHAEHTQDRRRHVGELDHACTARRRAGQPGAAVPGAVRAGSGREGDPQPRGRRAVVRDPGHQHGRAVRNSPEHRGELGVGLPYGGGSAGRRGVHEGVERRHGERAPRPGAGRGSVRLGLVVVDATGEVGRRERRTGADRGRAPTGPVQRVAERPDLGAVRPPPVVGAHRREAGHDRRVAVDIASGGNGCPAGAARAGTGRHGQPAVGRTGQFADGPHRERSGRPLPGQPPQCRRPRFQIAPSQPRHADEDDPRLGDSRNRRRQQYHRQGQCSDQEQPDRNAPR